MTPLLKWLRETSEFVIKLTKEQRSILLGFFIIIGLLFVVIKFDKKINTLETENKIERFESNKEIGRIKDSFALKELKDEQLIRVSLEQQLAQYKQLEEDARKIKKNNDKILKKIK